MLLENATRLVERVTGGRRLEHDSHALEVESQLRDVIAGNTQSISVRGRHLTLYVDSDGRKGIEYPTRVGPIDIWPQISILLLFSN